nr:hypothetical transcript [Hymenolepis microstoma]
MKTQKKERCRYSGGRARSASQTRPAYSEKLLSLFTASHDAQKTEITRSKDSSTFSSQYNGEIRRRPYLERLKQAEEEEERIVGMPTAGCHEKHEKWTIKEKELHILENE